MLNFARKKLFSAHFCRTEVKSALNFRDFRDIIVRSFSTINDNSQNTTALDKPENAYIDSYRKGSITFVVDYPLFPISKYQMHLSTSKYKILSKAAPRYVSAVVRKQNDKKQDEEMKDDVLSVNVTDDFYKMGAYCQLDYPPEIPNTIILTSLYRIEMEEIIRYKLPELTDTSGFETPEQHQPENTDQVIGDIDSAEKIEIDTEIDPQEGDEQRGTEKKSSATQEQQRLRWIIERAQKANEQVDQRGHTIEQKTILVSKVKPVVEPEFIMNINIETKLKHMINIYTKILQQYVNRSNWGPLNYNLKDATRILDDIGSFITTARYFKTEEMQEAFDMIEFLPRLDKMHMLLRKYHDSLEHMAYIRQIAQQNINARKSKEYLDEVMRVLKGIVEEGKGKNGVIEKLRARLKEKKPPQHAMKVFEEEAKRFMSLDEASAESTTIRKHLEWIASLPFGVQTEDEFNIEKAKTILDADHYGLEDVKQRILEFIAVGNLKKTLEGKILCLVGPPGVGKTSLASSIARSLNRKYYRIALGGERDSSTLKGHRRTYIGAYPGKIVQALKECGSENCVILLDEIDKVGKSAFHGDPQSNLLEILDPAQNKNFTDNYLDFPIDLSKVLFLCSANILDTISAPLRDRMDIVQLSGYTNEEKLHIFNSYLLPRNLEQSGLTKDHGFRIEPEVTLKLVNDYCREAGVRSLERYTKKILEKIAFEVVQRESSGSHEEIVVNLENLPKFIQHPKFPTSRFYEKTPPVKTLFIYLSNCSCINQKGVTVGLAYTEYGGSLIFLEATESSFPKEQTHRTGGLKTTGMLGDVMKESMQIAYSYAKHYAYNQLKSDYFERTEIHIHAPEGATPKDGPSAGVAITTALLSLAMKKPVKQNLGMTGEMSLRGQVLKIGGVKEKILAAKREKITEVMFPKENEDDVLELKKYITEGLTVHYASTYDDVFKIAFES